MKNDKFDMLTIESRDSMRNVVAAQLKRDSLIHSRGDSISPDGKRIRLNKRGEVRKPFISDSMSLSKVCWLSLPLPGFGQIYNKQYWKLPVVYGGIGALAGTGGYYLHQYKKSGNTDLQAKNTGTWLMVGAGLVYWGSLMDGVASYKSAREPNPGRAALYSALLPGLGQVYNGEYFKVPIYWGCLLGATHFLMNNNTNYKRFKRIHNEATTDPNYSAQISAETAKWYRDEYRRYRDYSIVATALFYFLQVIDANVFAYMHDFEVTDDITMNIEPSVIAPDNVYAMHTSTHLGQNAVGLRLGIRF
jgi:hypothetical protein